MTQLTVFSPPQTVLDIDHDPSRSSKLTRSQNRFFSHCARHWDCERWRITDGLYDEQECARRCFLRPTAPRLGVRNNESSIFSSGHLLSFSANTSEPPMNQGLRRSHGGGMSDSVTEGTADVDWKSDVSGKGGGTKVVEAEPMPVEIDEDWMFSNHFEWPPLSFIHY